MLAEAFPARTCLQVPENPGAKSQYTNWDARQGLQEPHTPIPHPVAQVLSPSRAQEKVQTPTTLPFEVFASFLSPEHLPWAPAQRQPCNCPDKAAQGPAGKKPSPFP